MAKNFRTSVLTLGNQTVSADAQNLYLNGSPLSGQVGSFSTIANLYQTGSDLSTRISNLASSTITGSGIVNRIPIWRAGGTGLGNSSLSESNALITTSSSFQPNSTLRNQSIGYSASGALQNFSTSTDLILFRDSGNISTTLVGINNGTTIGEQRLIYCDSGTFTINSSGNRLLNGDFTLTSGSKLKLMWNGTYWMEEYRFPPQTGSLTGSITNISGANPTTNTLTVPVSIPVYGNTSALLGNPSGFLLSTLSGITIKIPYYI